MDRRKSNSEKSIGRKNAFRLALVLSIASTGVSVAQESSLPALPQLERTVSLPAPPWAKLSPKKATDKLVGLLGLGSSKQRVPRPALSSEGGAELNVPQAEQEFQDGVSFEDPTSFAGSVVPAASEEQVSSRKQSNQSPDLSSSGDRSSEDSGSLSLIDLDLELTATPTEQATTPLVSENFSDTKPTESRQPAIVSSDRKLSLSVSSSDSALRKETLSSGKAKVESEAQSVSEAQAVSQQESFQSFSLSDREETQPTVRAESVARAENTSRGPARPMRVQVEGEPATVVAGHSLPTDRSSRDIPTPTFENKPETGRTSSENAVAKAPTSPMPVAAVAMQAASRSPNADEPSSRRTPASLASSRRKIEESKTAQPTAPSTASKPLQIPSDFQKGPALSVAANNAIQFTQSQDISELSVEHEGVCRVVQVGSRGISVIGVAPGNTRIAIVMLGAEGKPAVEIREVTVAADQLPASELTQVAADLTRTVTALYPNSDIEIVVADERLIIQGTVSSESQAKKVLSLVRKTSLIPVVDQLRALR